jgi:hypothetical protein
MISVTVREVFSKTVLFDLEPGTRDEKQLVLDLKRRILDAYRTGKIHLDESDIKSIDVSIDNDDFIKMTDIMHEVEDEDVVAADKI